MAIAIAVPSDPPPGSPLLPLMLTEPAVPEFPPPPPALSAPIPVLASLPVRLPAAAPPPIAPFGLPTGDPPLPGAPEIVKSPERFPGGSTTGELGPPGSTLIATKPGPIGAPSIGGASCVLVVRPVRASGALATAGRSGTRSCGSV